ncbi:threonine synthase [Saccharopolyspora antimicrobica]|uniref:Threonine synthase n=1 Tax=Saccharopolyspora antimicrobica TaxID=455193 RepID=A0A1I4W3L5_9PSEU|nr:pyridoxal-phosphate dependent enzyme [Saccharopolyspora antimicrobica]RKT87088.1 threonine synthase-related protein [Saccharopolyspora antimicrobica]SFN07890.1 threonine synthase [Saccharopolyspora antimicrobica]
MEHKQPTSLLTLGYLTERLRLPHIYAKCEIENPTRTQKDRIADGLVLAAFEAGARGITVGSCGNLGVALALASRARGLLCTVFVPRSFHHTRCDEMTALGAEVIPRGACYEAAVEASRKFARARKLFDANLIGRAGQIAIFEYGAIVDELVAQCPVSLGSIWLPVGNGTCAAGVRARLQQRKLAVRIGVVGSTGNTALTASLAAGRLIELDAAKLQETEVNEPLVNWRSLHAREAMEAVRGSGGYFCDATDTELVAASNSLLTNAIVRTIPSGAAGLVGLQTFSTRLNPTSAHVVIITA